VREGGGGANGVADALACFAILPAFSARTQEVEENWRRYSVFMGKGLTNARELQVHRRSRHCLCTVFVTGPAPGADAEPRVLELPRPTEYIHRDWRLERRA
jgi:hypothetical protein